MTARIGQMVTYWSNYGDGIANEEAALVVSRNGEKVNLVVWSAAGVMSNRHEVSESREACPGCWSPLKEAQAKK